MARHMSMISFSICLLVVYRKVTDMCNLILYPATLLNLFIVHRSLLVKFLGCLMHNNISSANRDSLISFPICILLISFPCLHAPAITSSPELKRNGDGHLCLISDFGVIAFSFSPLRMMLAVDFSVYLLIY